MCCGASTAHRCSTRRSCGRCGCCPTEYLYYYYSPDTALANIRQAGQTRGQAIQALNDRLFQDLAAAGADRRRVYEDYLAARNAGYMQIESGSSRPIARSPWSELTGYDKIALSVLRAVHLNSTPSFRSTCRTRVRCAISRTRTSSRCRAW